MLISLLPTAAFAADGQTQIGREEEVSSNEDYAYIEKLLTDDDSISFDPNTQTFLVVEINESVSNNVTRLINKGLLEEDAMATAMDMPYYMFVSINGEDVTETKDFYIYDGETVSKESKEEYRFSVLAMQMVSADKGKNVIIANCKCKLDSCTVEIS